MIIRKLPPSVYNHLCRDLAAHAFALSLEPCYTVGLVTGGTEYHLKLQPEGHCRMAPFAGTGGRAGGKRPQLFAFNPAGGASPLI